MSDLRQEKCKDEPSQFHVIKDSAELILGRQGVDHMIKLVSRLSEREKDFVGTKFIHANNQE